MGDFNLLSLSLASYSLTMWFITRVSEHIYVLFPNAHVACATTLLCVQYTALNGSVMILFVPSLSKCFLLNFCAWPGHNVRSEIDLLWAREDSLLNMVLPSFSDMHCMPLTLLKLLLLWSKHSCESGLTMIMQFMWAFLFQINQRQSILNECSSTNWWDS